MEMEMETRFKELEKILINNSKRFKELKKIGGAAKPIGISIAVTGRCNSHCIQCSIWKICRQDIYNPDMIKEEMTLEEILSYLSDPMMDEVVEVDLTGGEPYLRDDIEDIVLGIVKLKEKSVLKNLKTIVIPSNGFLTDIIVPKVATILDGIKGTGVDFVAVFSLDGIGEKHDFMRGTKNAFLWVNRTIEALQEQRKTHADYFFMGIKATIIHDNVNELGNMLDYANKRNMFFIISSVIIAQKRFRNIRWKDRLMLKEEDMEVIRKFYQNKAMEFDFYYRKIFDSRVSGEKKWICTALYNYLFIDYDRKVYPCPIQDDCVGDLTNNSISEILNSQKAAEIRKKVGNYPICRQCTEPGTVRYSQILEGEGFLDFIRTSGPENLQETVFNKGLHKLLLI
jgi:MoaA/NifB/PqqE/SkfB family radical SAM enzyme